MTKFQRRRIRKKILKKRKKGSTLKDRKSPRYTAWRKAVYKRDNMTCRRCGAKNKYFNAHHIRPWSLFPLDRYDVDNGVTLCQECHKQVHKSKRSIFLDLGYGRGKGIPARRPRKSKVHKKRS